MLYCYLCILRIAVMEGIISLALPSNVDAFELASSNCRYMGLRCDLNVLHSFCSRYQGHSATTS